MYEAHRESDVQLKIYFLIHAATVEEQSYLTTLRREKEAFEFLIETKAVSIFLLNQVTYKLFTVFFLSIKKFFESNEIV